MNLRKRRLLFALWIVTVLTLPSSTLANFSLRQPPAVPTIVKVGFYLSEINSVNEQQENFEFEGRLIATWRDPRLAFDPALAGTPVKTYTGSFQFTELFEGWWPQFVLANESGFFEEQAIFLKVESDGEIHLIREISALAEMPLDLHRFPFDRQHFSAKFLVLGYEKSEVRLEPDLAHTGRDDGGVQIAQWHLNRVEVVVDDFRPHLEGHLEPEFSRMVAMFDMERRPQFMLRIIGFPLTLLCLLCGSVFWMVRESLGDRMTISFTGLLTVVAYQFLVSGNLPMIAYFTLMDGFLYSTYLFVAGTIVVNLRVDHLDRTGRQAVGVRLDEKCRWAFPLAFFAGNSAMALAFFGI